MGVNESKDSLGTRSLAKLMRRLRAGLEMAVLLAVLLASGLIVLELWPRSRRPTDSASSIPVPTNAVSLDGAPRKGNSDAKVVLIIYSDFQCPFCASFARDTLPQIEREYVENGVLALAFRNMPLARIHPLATAAATAGVCANRQGRFWQWHDAMFTPGLVPEHETVQRVSIQAGVELLQLNACLSKGEAAEQVGRELAEAKSLGIKSTPTFILGVQQPDGNVNATTVISGNRPFSHFKTAIEKLVTQPQAQ